MTARIFVCRDTGLAPLLDEVIAGLEARGHQIVRGAIDTPGQRKSYADAELAIFADVDAAIFTPRHACTRAVMAAAPRLRGVCSPVIGVESIDLDAAADLGIIIGHGAVRENVVGMAEATVMLMLMLLYDVQTNVARMRDGLWRRSGHHGHQIEGRTVGLIGFGRIAREIAHRLDAFGARVVTYSPRARAEDLPAHVGQVALDTLMRDSDIVTVLTGLTPETHHLIDARLIAMMKPTAYLVNTARGAIVDEAALTDALRDGRIAGAALDTFEIEPLPVESPLRNMANVIPTPHCVGHTVEGWEAFVPALIDNVEAMLRGDLPPYCKNPEVAPRWRARLAAMEGQG